MTLIIWRLTTIMLVALSMATVFCHLMEMPAKLNMDAGLWLTLLQTLYPPMFGTVGGAFEVGGLVATLVLAFAMRGHGAALGLTVTAAACIAVAHAIFWLLIAPVNAALVPLTPDTLPPDFGGLRDRWEYSHAVRAALQVIALASLVLSVLLDVPRAASASRRRRFELRHHARP